MQKFTVVGKIPVWVTVEVEADTKEEAEEKAHEVAYLQGYAGNGATSGKLLGTSEHNVTLCAGDDLNIVEVEVSEK